MECWPKNGDPNYSLTYRHDARGVYHDVKALQEAHMYIFIYLLLLCVVTPFHEWAMGSLPPAGCPPTWQEGPGGVRVSV